MYQKAMTSTIMHAVRNISHRKRFSFRMLILGLLALAWPLPCFSSDTDKWASDGDGRAVVSDMQALLKGASTRIAGSEGNLAVEAEIAELFGKSGHEHGQISFRAPCFKPGNATLTRDGASPVTLHPLHPTLFAPGNFTESEFDTRLIDLGDATAEDLARIDGIELEGAIVVLNMTAPRGWLDLMRFGIRGFLFVGGETHGNLRIRALVHSSEVGIPRFYVSQEEGAQLRDAVATAEGSLPVHIESTPSRWKNQTLHDLWAFIPGSDEALARDIVVLTAPMDSNCIVPSLAKGAQAGANLHMMVRLMKSFSAQAPQRSVLLVAVNAHAQNYLGERLLAWNLLAPLTKLEALRNTINDDMREQELYLKYLSTPTEGSEDGLYSDDAHRKEDEAYLIKLRTLQDKSLGYFVSVKDPLVNLAKRDVNRLRSKQYDIAKREGATPEAAAHREVLEKERLDYVAVMTLFNKFGVHTTTLSDLYSKSPNSVRILHGYVKELRERYRRWSNMNRADIAASAANQGIRKLLNNRRVAFVLTLQLDWSNDRIGFSSDNFWGVRKWQTQFGRNTTRIAEELLAKGKNPNLLEDTLTGRDGLLEGFHFPALTHALLAFHHANATPAFSLRNTGSDFGRAFLPEDTIGLLNAQRVAGTMAFTEELLRGILADPDITLPSELPRYGGKSLNWSPLWSVQVKTMQFDEFSASVLPTLPIENAAVLAYGGSPTVTADGVFSAYMALTDERASAVLYGVQDLPNKLTSQASQYDADFTHVIRTIDAGDKARSVSSDIQIQSDSVHFAMFPCEATPLYVRSDSSKLAASPIEIKLCHILGGESDSPPNRYGFSGIGGATSVKLANIGASGPGAIYRDIGDRVKILTPRKRGGIGASDEFPEGAGYGPGNELPPDFLAASAKDMQHLNNYRADELQGVSDSLVREFMSRGDRALTKMADAMKSNDHLGYLRSLYMAIGAEAKAYEQTTTVTNDMLKAVVFYMALLLPFCFFLQKLLFKIVKVEYQMGMFALIFVATFVVFRFIHPAFRIASAPEAMFIAFIMGILGFFVIQILHSRFEGEMQILFQTYSGMSTTEVRYSTAGQQAMLIGVNNMKRRRVRTALTTATIVLVTFTMLAFTSISKKVSPTMIAKPIAPPYTGIMYHWPGQPMDEASRNVFMNMFTGRGTIVERRWLQASSLGSGVRTKMVPLGLRAEPSGKLAQAEAALGLSVKEDGFLAPMPIMPGGRFFSADDASEAIISSSMADALAVTHDDLKDAHVVFMGQRLRVVGVLDDDRFRSIRDINDVSLLPLKPGEKIATGEGSDSESVDEPEITSARHVEMGGLFLLPVDTMRRFQGNKPYSLSIRFDDDTPIWPIVEEVLTSTRAKIYVSSKTDFRVGGVEGREVDPGVFYVGSGYRTSVGGLSVLIIPLLIASTIILNTMLGSVYERRSEIAVYNAVGLNPTHIGMFFLAEAFVYGVIGSVGGYLIGQVLSITLNKFGLVSDVNLNFSSLSVVYVILFTVSIVMLSTLYPAHAATKEAVPSGKRKWSMPSGDGQRMRIAFPFIYSDRLLPGIMAYLQAYFSRFGEASMGEIVAQQLEKISVTEEGHAVYQLRYHIALPPYDLGVTQEATFIGKYDSTVRAHRVFMDLERISGQDSNWRATNKPFLENLRQYMMHWRNLDAEQHDTFVRQGKES